jgi:hypothetical protein
VKKEVDRGERNDCHRNVDQHCDPIAQAAPLHFGTRDIGSSETVPTSRFGVIQFFRLVFRIAGRLDPSTQGQYTTEPRALLNANKINGRAAF